MRGIVLWAAAVAGSAAAVLATMAGAAAVGQGTGQGPVLPPPVAAGPPVLTAHQSGYVASGRLFRYVQAVITVPRLSCAAGVAQPLLFVALAGPDGYARAGLECGPWPRRAAAASASRGSRGRHRGWHAFIAVRRRGRPPVLATFPLTGLGPGDGVFASVFSAPAGGAVRCVIALPGRAAIQRAVAVPGAAYQHAQMLADWPSSRPAPKAAKTRMTQFLSGAITTIHGKHGTFQGRWLLAPWRATGGMPGSAGSAPVASPGYLWTDGTQIVLNGRGDAFGVWLRP
jgi:hypothetical protein